MESEVSNVVHCTTYDVVVDYNCQLAQMIQAGNYDSVYSDIIAEHFPISGKGRHEISVVLSRFLNREMAFDKVIAEMNQQGCRPAKIEELLALGEAIPYLQKNYPIVALGSFWRAPNGNRYVPLLLGCVGKRGLHLSWLGTAWSANCRFLGVRRQAL